jgi:hypothetical protein
MSRILLLFERVVCMKCVKNLFEHRFGLLNSVIGSPLVSDYSVDTLLSTQIQIYRMNSAFLLVL